MRAIIVVAIIGGSSSRRLFPLFYRRPLYLSISVARASFVHLEESDRHQNLSRRSAGPYLYIGLPGPGEGRDWTFCFARKSDAP